MTKVVVIAPKTLCPETLLRNFDLDTGKKIMKDKKTVFLLMASAFCESN